MKKCLYCNKDLEDNYFENKVGFFCSEQEFHKYLDSLSNEEYVKVQNSFCTCSD